MSDQKPSAAALAAAGLITQKVADAMIKNERQYRFTKGMVSKFESAISEMVNQKVAPGVDPLLAIAEVDAMRSKLDDLKRDVIEYERLKSGEEVKAK